MLTDATQSESPLVLALAARLQAEVQLQQTTHELDQHVRALAQTARALQLRERAIEASANAIVITSAAAPNYLIEYVNPAFERITGYSADEVIGRNCKFLQGDDDDQGGLDEIRAALREQREGNAVLRNYRKDATQFWNHLYVAPVRDAAGIVTHFVASQYDITAAKNDEAKLTYMAHHDELTDLPNRTYLRECLRQAIVSADRYKQQIWVIFVSLDRFKVINDTFGHRGRDSVLKVTADRLREATRSSDTVAHWGGDEFAIVMPEQADGALVTATLQRILDVVNATIPFGGEEIFLNCSMGVSKYPEHGADCDTLLDRADIAASHAKRHGRNNFRFHTSAMNELAAGRLRIGSELRQAIEREQFVLHYQPQVELSTGRVIGMEALIRWQHPQRGLVYPADFIAIAEETGLIVPIGAWVLRRACLQNRQWQRDGFAPMRVAVNVSARQFAQADLASTIAAVLLEVGLAPDYLELELTESLIMNDVGQAIGALRELKALGVRIAVDDFGTGYSSLAYLKRLPIDVLKIDRAFVADIGAGDGDDAAIVTSIITLAHALKLKVIAEGVEIAEQLDYLRRNACDEMQGYYFSKPVDADAFAELLRAATPLMLTPC
ncbi:MAG: EAL domain-containing protein [Massilia sp.]|nr:EAL domain-containing protein [Massilia sp.]